VTVRRDVSARALLLAAATATLLACPAPSFGGGEPPQSELPTPATRAAVARLMERSQHGDVAEALRLVDALRRAGGHEAVGALVALAARPEPELQAKALLALSALGLRTEKSAEVARRGARSKVASVRDAGIEALGRIGDGRDVAALLEGMASGDGEVRAVSYRAIRELSGLWMKASPTRWVLWWSKAKTTAKDSARKAAREVEDAVEGEREDAETHLGLVVRNGWVDVAASRDLARTWIHSADRRLRSAGFRLAAGLRLGDLAGAVETALPFAQNGEDRFAALDAARVLGVAAAPSVSTPGG
jgi:hypothetical protein